MDYSLADVALLLTAGLAAGAVNAVAGGGSLLTFPALLAAGLPPVSANVTNSVAVTPGYLASVHASRADLDPRRARALLPTAVAGAVIGCVLLLVTPARAFDLVVPFLVLGATALLAFQGRIRGLVGRPRDFPPRRRAATLHTLTALAAVYGGYFGAAAGIMLMAVLALVTEEAAHRVVALKNVLSAVIGLVTVLVYAVFGPVSWLGVLLVAPATAAGGYLGAFLTRRLSPAVLHVTVVGLGTVVGIVLLAQAFDLF